MPEPHIHKIHIREWAQYAHTPDAFRQLMYSQTQATLIALENVPAALWPIVRDTLFARLQQQSPIQALSLRNIPWTPEDLEAFSNILKPKGARQHPAQSLYDLDMSQQDWSDLSLMQDLSKLLADLPLRGLSLGGCVFTKEGISLLSSAVMRLTRLKTLDLSYTKMSNESLELLKAHLVSNMTLRVLYLNHCQLDTDKARDALVEWIRASALRECHLEGNFYKNSSARKVLRSTWQESTLRHLYCDADSEGETEKHARILRRRTYQLYWGQVRSCAKAMCSSIILGFLLLGTALSVSTILIGGAVIGLAWGLMNLPKKPPPDHPMPFTPVAALVEASIMAPASTQSVVRFSVPQPAGVTPKALKDNILSLNTLS